MVAQLIWYKWAYSWFHDIQCTCGCVLYSNYVCPIIRSMGIISILSTSGIWRPVVNTNIFTTTS